MTRTLVRSKGRSPGIAENWFVFRALPRDHQRANGSTFQLRPEISMLTVCGSFFCRRLPGRCYQLGLPFPRETGFRPVRRNRDSRLYARADSRYDRQRVHQSWLCREPVRIGAHRPGEERFCPRECAYGNWTGVPVWVRVRAEIVPISEAGFRLQCNAWMVRDHGVAAFEEEIKLNNFQGRPWQKLLDEVGRKLTPERQP